MIEEEVPDLDVNAWYLDDGDLAGTKEQLQQAVDILLREGPPRGFVLSVRENVTFPSEPKSLVWCPVDLHGATGDADPLDRGVPRHRGLGVTVLGAPVGNEEAVKEALQKRVDKVEQITSLLHNMKDPHMEFCLLRSCLALPKIMFNVRTVDTTPFLPLLQEFDRTTREALVRILGSPVSDQQWQQAKLPVSMGGLGLTAAEDHAPTAYISSLLSSRPLVSQLLSNA